MKKIILILIIILGVGVWGWRKIFFKKTENKTANETVRLEPTRILVSPTVTVIPTKKLLSFEEMNKISGPCAVVKVMMYHHVEEDGEAKKKNITKLAVDPETFRKQMQYLKDNGYSIVGPEEMVNFFDNAGQLPKKTAMITMDDAYEDNYRLAWPILKEFGYKATVFVPTGLVNNENYLSWQNISEMNAAGIYFGNHTWSHKSSSGTVEAQKKEIELADQQLAEKGQNQLKIFAYPYGTPSNNAEKVLSDLGYKMAFTTNYGTVLCRGKRLEMPRVRIEKGSLKNYGF